jgi:elongation factor 1 alpha-like protein
VVDATTGEFEAGFEANGQTKEHALLARSLGVQQLVVAINKLDVVSQFLQKYRKDLNILTYLFVIFQVDWSQDRYDEIITKLNLFLSQAGFKKDKVVYIPCSGLIGENLLKKSQNVLEWYSGPTLVEQIGS